ncbi:segregation and condensation protein A [Defluviitalea phaphyphila]|uniref:segregation and condensation protein A n=1 Tax=Defluviitalea phaphyphila TaxID=1473580 RepID=UPI000731727D|nr:segregation/condensation protein A [Defluviitalea phaphyphila]
MSIQVKLEVFEGPFELLFHLIEKNKINIYDIPIALITDQYMEYISSFEHKNMENMSEFLVMAATLLEIKSKMLLPNFKENEEPEEDPREELVNKLLEYKKIKHVSEKLKERQKEAQKVFFRTSNIPENIKYMLKNNSVDINEILDGITLQNMFAIFQDLLRKKDKKIDTIRSEFKSVQKDIYKIEDKITYIMDLLTLSPAIYFHDLFLNECSKMEVVVTFLALLELIRSRKVNIEQKSPFEDIFITKYDGVDISEID